jgi:hypothetical protein
MTNTEIIARWNWNPAEIEALETEGYAAIAEKFAALTDELYNRVCDNFTAWIMGEVKKTEFTKARKAAKVTEAEVNIWMTV